MKIPSLRHSLSTRLLRIVFSSYLVIAISVTLIHMGVEYFHSKEDVLREFASYERIFAPELAASLWDLDREKIQRLARAMMEVPTIEGVVIESVEGTELIAQGKFRDRQGILHFAEEGGAGKVRELNRSLAEVFEFTFPISHSFQGQGVNVGRATLFSSSRSVFQRIQMGFVLLIINAFIKTLAIWVIFLWVSRKMLTRPLYQLTAATQNFDPQVGDSSRITIDTPEGNELKLLEEAFNGMVARISRELSDRKQTARSLSENNQALLVYKRELEETVESKVVALRKALDRLQKSERRFKDMADLLPSPIYETDRNHRITYINRAGSRMFGRAAEELVGHAAVDFFVKKDRERLKRQLRQCMTGETKKGIEYALAMDPKKSVVMSGAPIFEGDEITGVRASLTDISKRKRAEDEARKAMEKAESSDLAKTRFLANMSHEIRTPMNGLLGMAEILLNSDLTKEQQDEVQVILKAGEALLALVDDILDFSKIEAEKLVLSEEDFDLRTCLEQVCDLLAAKAHDKGLTLMVHMPPELPGHVRGDPGRLRQVLLNLVNNAIKFTHRGLIHISVTHMALNELDSEFHFKIRDTGIGVPKNRVNQLFKVFSQVDNSNTRKYGGTGLGLAICKQLVTRMGGEIAVEQTGPRGTTFSFSVRLRMLAQQPDPFGLCLKGMHVLVADELEEKRLILCELLNHAGCRVSQASDAGQVFSCLWDSPNHGQPIEAMLLDAQLPGLDWEHLARRLKEAPETKKVSVFWMTTRSHRERDPGEVSAVLLKPVKRHNLLTKLRQIMSDEPSPGQRPALPEEPQPRRTFEVLIVEDNRINQKVAIRMVEQLGHSWVLANDGQEALEAVKKNSFDLILMDCQMPHMDGFEATRAIRGYEGEKRRTPIVALTANVQKEDQQLCYEAGMDGFLRKPIKKSDLATMFEEIFPPVA